MSNTSWDVVTAINTGIVNQQLTNQLKNISIDFNQNDSDLSGNHISLNSIIDDIEILAGSSGQTLILALTLNGSVTFTTVSNLSFTYQIDSIVIPVQCSVESYSSTSGTTVSLPLNSAVLAVDQLNEAVAVAALVAQGDATPSNDGVLQAVANAITTGLQQTTAVGAQLAEISNLAVAHAQASVQQIGCAVQQIAGGAVLYMMLSYSGTAPLPVDINASLSASLSAQNQAVVYFSQDFFMGTILGNGTLPNGQGFSYSPATATLNLGSPYGLPNNGTLQQFTWQAIGAGIAISATAVWSSGSGPLNITVTDSFNATFGPVVQGNLVVLEPMGTPQTNQNVDKGWLVEIADWTSLLGGLSLEGSIDMLANNMQQSVGFLVANSLMGSVSRLVSWSRGSNFAPTAATLNNGLSIVGTVTV